MAWTQSDLDRIDAAISNGTSSVTFSDGRSVKYNSVSDLMRARQLIQRTLSGSKGLAYGLIDFRQRTSGEYS